MKIITKISIFSNNLIFLQFDGQCELLGIIFQKE